MRKGYLRGICFNKEGGAGGSGEDGLFSFIEDPDQRKQAEETYTTGIKADVATAVEKEVSGLKTKNDELLGEVKKFKKQLKDFEGFDMAAAKDAMKFLETNREAQLIKDGKFDELLEKKTSAMRTEFEGQISEFESKLNSSQETASSYKQRFEKKIVEDSIRNAALGAGVRTEALEDVLYRGGSVFKLGEDGSVEARDEHGKLRKTDDDIIMNPKNWVESLKDSAPHYWPPSKGLDAGGGGTKDDLLEAMDRAIKNNDMKEYRRLREKREKIRA